MEQMINELMGMLSKVLEEVRTDEPRLSSFKRDLLREGESLLTRLMNELEAKANVPIEKPDFESMRVRDESLRVGELIEFINGCDKIWYEYFLPTAAERDRLKKENERLKGELNQFLTSSYNDEKAKLQSLNKELFEGLKELYMYEYGGNSETLQEAMDMAPTIKNDFEQKIISLLKKASELCC